MTHGYPTSDKLFLLSEEEAKKYFKDNKDRVAHDLNGNSDYWWLRSLGNRNDVVANVRSDGYVSDDGDFRVGYPVGGVRVALLWNLDS